MTGEETIGETVTQEPVTEVVAVGVGTKPAPAAPATAVDPGASAGGEASGLNWAGLADGESSGNPRAVNPAGYYGRYQFRPPDLEVGGRLRQPGRLPEPTN
ncbi:MAG: hypothetical protein ACK5PP_19360 [Acidimicrobiales bacterium]